jgi:alkylhydroperoxidase family enzyme
VAPIAPPLRAMLGYLEKVTLTPEALTADDARLLKVAGVTKAAAKEALWVAYCFNQIARVADALGWEIPEAAGFTASAKSLLSFGYLMPFHSKQKA